MPALVPVFKIKQLLSYGAHNVVEKRKKTPIQEREPNVTFKNV